MLRIWHSMCRMIAGILYSVDQQLQGQDDRVKRSYRDGFVKGQVEGSSSHGQWKAKFSVTVRFDDPRSTRPPSAASQCVCRSRQSARKYTLSCLAT